MNFVRLLEGGKMKKEIRKSDFLKLSDEGKAIVCQLIAKGLLIIQE